MSEKVAVRELVFGCFLQIKQGNRRSEFLLHDAELVSTVALALGNQISGELVLLDNDCWWWWW